jgi:hypothetical protein
MWKNDNKNNPEKPQYYSGTPCTGVLRVHTYRQCIYSYSEYSGVPRKCGRVRELYLEKRTAIYCGKL